VNMHDTPEAIAITDKAANQLMLRELNAMLLEALRGVIKVADRATIEFDAAHAAIAKAEGVQP
jgi:hypothetical protein